MEFRRTEHLFVKSYKLGTIIFFFSFTEKIKWCLVLGHASDTPVPYSGRKGSPKITEIFS